MGKTIIRNLDTFPTNKLLVNLKASSIIRKSFYNDCNKLKELTMIEIWSKPNCIFCEKAEKLCQIKGLEYKKYMLDVDFSREDLLIKFPTARTFPQITENEQYIGGYTELEKYLK